MAKIKAFATATGDRNSYILLQPGSQIPDGYTAIEPPLQQKSCSVVWSENNWEQRINPDSEDAA